MIAIKITPKYSRDLIYDTRADFLLALKRIIFFFLLTASKEDIGKEPVDPTSQSFVERE